MCGTCRITAPYLQDILLREAHVFVHHELGLHMNIQRHQDENERQYELKAHQDIAQHLSLHAHCVRPFQHKRSGLGRGIERRSDTSNHGREQCDAEHQNQDSDIILQRNTIRHIGCP